MINRLKINIGVIVRISSQSCPKINVSTLLRCVDSSSCPSFLFLSISCHKLCFFLPFLKKKIQECEASHFPAFPRNVSFFKYVGKEIPPGEDNKHSRVSCVCGSFAVGSRWTSQNVCRPNTEPTGLVPLHSHARVITVVSLPTPDHHKELPAPNTRGGSMGVLHQDKIFLKSSRGRDTSVNRSDAHIEPHHLFKKKISGQIFIYMYNVCVCVYIYFYIIYSYVILGDFAIRIY